MSETGTRIAVALTTDDNNILPMSVTITSLLETAAENTFCDVYIFMQNQPRPQIAERIMSFERLYSRCAIHPRTVDPDALNCAVVSVKHLGLANFYRLLLPTLLPRLDKVIYLDTDTLVMRDLAGLYALDIGDNYMAGVRAANFVDYDKAAKRRAKTLGIPSLNQYINNGVMLMNLAAMRRDRLQKKMVELTAKDYGCPCQDITNAVGYGRTTLLPFRFNVSPKHDLSSEEAFFSQRGCRICYTRDEYRQAMESPVIIHFINKTSEGPTKPWNMVGLPFAEDWWNSAQLSPFWPEILQMYGSFNQAIHGRTAPLARPDSIDQNKGDLL